MTEQHECEWRLTVGHSSCKACHYSAIEGVAVCEICNESLGPTEIERRLNKYEKLKRDYRELIMAVGKKHEGETRHETALRYILEAEQGSDTASTDILKDG